MKPLEIRSLNRKVYHPKGMKMCTRCTIIKPRTDEFFVVNSLKTKKRDRHKGFCKECNKKSRRIQKLELRKNIKQYFNRIIANLRHRSKEINVPFNVTGEYLYNQYIKQNSLCYWTGKNFDMDTEYPDKSRPGDNFLSVDRLDPKKGYVEGNLVLCLWKVNQVKNNLDSNQFLDLCSLITKRFENDTLLGRNRKS